MNRHVWQFAVGVLSLGLLGTGRAAEKPNIVLIMADDFGYECVGANGGQSYSTPNLDRLASTGVRFDHCYVQPLCTPTRVQLMTGQYNVRNYVRFGFLDPTQTTFAHLLKKAGYVTGIVGKWQLGNGPQGPTKFGFDESCLWQLTRRPPRYANPGLEINGQERDFANGEYGPDLVNDYALEFISRHKAEPFFLYYPMMLTHGPYQPTPDSDAWDPTAIGEKVNQRKKHFADMTQYMDKLIGKLVDRLQENGLREKTLIIFLGDNGTGRGTESRWRGQTIHGGKGQLTDAGTRVPLIVNWPGKARAGSVVSDLVDSSDFLPTLADAAGVPTNGAWDGRSFLPQVRGEKGTPREWTYCWYSPNQKGVDKPREFARTHKYKLFRDGSFILVESKSYQETKLADDALDPAAAAAKSKLQGVLDKFKDARPERLAHAAAAPVDDD